VTVGRIDDEEVAPPPPPPEDVDVDVEEPVGPVVGGVEPDDELDEDEDELVHFSVSYAHDVEQKTPLQLSEHGKLSVTVGMASGHPQRCVAVARPRQAGIGHVGHSSPVTVTVGQPVCVGLGGVSVGMVRVVAVTPEEDPSSARARELFGGPDVSLRGAVFFSNWPAEEAGSGKRTWRQECRRC
jgi:hypothetical protein